MVLHYSSVKYTVRCYKMHKKHWAYLICDYILQPTVCSDERMEKQKAFRVTVDGYGLKFR